MNLRIEAGMAPGEQFKWILEKKWKVCLLFFSDEQIFISNEQCGAQIWNINWKHKFVEKCPHRLDKKYCICNFLQDFILLFLSVMLSGSFHIRGLDWWIGLDCVAACKWQGLTTSKTMAKCDIATTWGRVRGANINDSFVAVFGTPLSVWRTIQLSNIWTLV